MTDAIYARCSTKKQDLDSQIAILKAKMTPGTLEYIDDGVSGMTRQRNGIDALLVGAREHKFDRLYVVEISRLGRSIKQIYDVVEELSKLGIKIILVKTNTELNYNSLEGRALLGGLALAAEIEWFLSQERWQRGRETIKRKGVKVGRKHKEVSVAAITSLSAQGMSLREIARELGVSAATIQRRFKKVGLRNVS